MSENKNILKTINFHFILKTLAIAGLLISTLEAIFWAWIIQWDLVDIFSEQRSILLGASMITFWIVFITFFIKDKIFFKKYKSLKIFYTWLAFRFVIGRLLFAYFTSTTTSNFNEGFLKLSLPLVYIPLTLIAYDFIFLLIIVIYLKGE